jgi:predicted transposase YbfD/YdcC
MKSTVTVLFPPELDSLQRVENNCGRIEARAIDVYGVTSEQLGFPHAKSAAMLMQATDQCKEIESTDEMVVYLLSSRSGLNAKQMLELKRGYWDIENGAHQRLDNSRFQEDKSRVRNRTSAHNLGLFRRAALSLARHWIDHQPNARLATTNGFFGEMKKNRSETAFRIVTSKKPSWLPKVTTASI